MSIGFSFEAVSARDGEEFTEERRCGCVIVRGAMDGDQINLYAKEFPMGMMSPFAARLAKATFVIGHQEDLNILIDELKDEAMLRHRYVQGFSVNLNRWIVVGDQGISSWAILSSLTGYCVDGAPFCHSTKNHPRDSDDFSRCRALLEIAPELRKDLSKMKDVSPEWSGLVEHWSELESIMDEEKGPRYGGGPVSFENTDLKIQEILNSVIVSES